MSTSNWPPKTKVEHPMNWTADEKDLLREMYPIRTQPEMAWILGRTVLAVRRMARQLQLTKRAPMRPWSEMELQVLHQHYETQGAMELALLLQRDPAVVRTQAQRMGLSPPLPSHHLPVGTERLRKGGFWYRKVAMQGLDQWKPISQLEQSPEVRELYRLLAHIHLQVKQMAE